MATLLGNKALGSIVKLTENGVPTDFIILHKNQPSSAYVGFNDGVTVCRKDVLPSVTWSTQNKNDYANSTIHASLSGYPDQIEQSIREQIKQVRIPYRPGAGTSKTVSSGASGLSCKVFLLSMTEVGYDQTFDEFPLEGVKLDYFLAGNNVAAANNLRIAKRSGNAAAWSLRTPSARSDPDGQLAYYVQGNGYALAGYITGSGLGPRPAFVLPDNMAVTDDGTVLPPTPPEIEALVFERRVFNGSWGVWQQIGIAPDMYFIDNVPTTGTQVQYRAKAVDNYGQESAYVTGPAKAIDYNKRPTITVEQSDLGTQTGAFSLAFSVDDADAADILTITATADGAPINITDAEGAQVPSITDAVRGQTYSVDISQTAYLRSPGGSHAITITLTDGKATVTQAVAWQRVVGGIDVINGPIGGEMEAMPTQISVSPLVTPMLIDLPSDVTYTVLVCNNCFDVAPAWEDCTTAVLSKRVYQFTNATKTAEAWGVKVRVTITKGATPTTITLRDVGVSMK